MPAAASESRDGRGRPRLRRSMAARMAASDVAADEAVRGMCGARDVAVGVAARTTVSRGCRGGRSRGDTEGKHIAAAADAAPTDGAARDGRGHF